MSGPVGDDTQPMKPVQPAPQPLPPPPPYAYAAPQPVRVVVRQAKPAPKKRSGVGCGQFIVIVGLAVVWVLSMGSSGNRETSSNMNRQSIDDKWRSFSFIESVETVNNHDGDVYSKVHVARGYVTEQTAEELRQAALSVAQFQTFIVVIDDGLSHVAFSWNLRNQAFDQTPITNN